MRTLSIERGLIEAQGLVQTAEDKADHDVKIVQRSEETAALPPVLVEAADEVTQPAGLPTLPVAGEVFTVRTMPATEMRLIENESDIFAEPDEVAVPIDRTELDVEALIADVTAAYGEDALAPDEPPDRLFEELTAEDDEADFKEIASGSILAAETDETKHLELLFDPETVEAYTQLAALSAMMEINSSVAREETKELEDDTTVELNLAVSANAAVRADFEAFVGAQPAPEEPVTLEAIQEQADNQPLEQTLLKLASLIEEATETPNQDSWQQILHDIETALPECYTVTEAGETRLHITPEMTEKLLMLLAEIGYHQPTQTLVGFVATYGPDFLLQALEYLSQRPDNRPELSAVLTIAATNRDDISRIRFIQNALFELAVPRALPVAA